MYLNCKTISTTAIIIITASLGISIGSVINESKIPVSEATTAQEIEDKFVDNRVVLPDRSIRSKKALHFHEPGLYTLPLCILFIFIVCYTN